MVPTPTSDPIILESVAERYIKEHWSQHLIYRLRSRVTLLISSVSSLLCVRCLVLRHRLSCLGVCSVKVKVSRWADHGTVMINSVIDVSSGMGHAVWEVTSKKGQRRVSWRIGVLSVL